jgi:hypothetical protein
MHWVKDAAARIGLDEAFAYAIATYFLFLYLNRIASKDARREISDWLRSKPSRRVDFMPAVVGAFDGLYSSPLFRPKAFLRSAVLTLLFTALMTWFISPMTFIFAYHVPEMRPQWIGQIITNIFSDYIALFVIRYYLGLGKSRLFSSILVAPILGAIVVAGLYIARDVAIFSISTRTFHLRYFWEGAQDWLAFIRADGSSNRALLLPALLIHAWLPLFGVSAIVTRLLSWLFRFLEVSHWFIRRRNEAPLQAIGLVAATIIFIGVSIFRILTN